MIEEHVILEIKAHAAECAPKECCGLVAVIKGRQRYCKCANLAEGGGHFIMSPEDFASVEDRGTVMLVVHSHVFESPEPSEADKVMCERTGVPWLIINHPVGTVTLTNPTGYEPPLIGRRWSHGILDCYSLSKDYYATIKIEIPDFDRQELWWEKGSNLILDNFEKAGFVEVSNLRLHDGIIMIQGSQVPNHTGVLCRDMIMLHHLKGRLSTEEVYGGYWRHITTKIVRHRSLL